MTTTRNVSVVVCCKNSQNTLDKCLSSIEKNNPDEIICIYGESSDMTYKIIMNHNIIPIEDNNSGLGAARNIGLSKARNDLILFIDSDIIISDTYFINGMINELEKNNWCAIHSKIISDEGNDEYFSRCENLHFKETFNVIGKKKALPMMCLLLDRSRSPNIELDRYFTGASEDGDFFKRIMQNGGQFGIGHSQAVHLHKNSINSFAKQRIWYGKGNAMMYKKYREINYLASPLLILGYGCFKGIKNKSIEQLPYYTLWSIFLMIGIAIEFSAGRKNHNG